MCILVANMECAVCVTFPDNNQQLCHSAFKAFEALVSLNVYYGESLYIFCVDVWTPNASKSINFLFGAATYRNLRDQNDILISNFTIKILTSFKGSDCVINWRSISCSGWGKHTAGVDGVRSKPHTSSLHSSGLVEGFRKPWTLWRAEELVANDDSMGQGRRLPGECEGPWTTGRYGEVCRWTTRG